MRKGFIDWLKKENPDVICLQEIKAFDSQFDTTVFESLGYHCFWHSAEKKGYSGVAILSKKQPNNIIYGCRKREIDIEGRILKIELGDVDGCNDLMMAGKYGYVNANIFIKKYCK